MEALLSNGWVVGTGGGVLSGLIVTWLTRILFSKKDQKDLAINISSANREILYAIRPEISENALPSVDVIEALKNATARKYKVESERLYTVSQVVEELIKEIMDSSFISSAAKREYCESLKVLAPAPASLVEPAAIDNEAFVARIEYKEKMTTLLSMTLGTIAALATMLSFVKSSFNSSPLLEKIGDTVFPMILVMVSVVMVMTAMQVALKLRHRKLRIENGIKPDESSNKLVN